MTQEEFHYLYKKYISGDCTVEEKKTLETYLEMTLPDNHWEPEFGDQEEIFTRVHQRLNYSINKKNSPAYSVYPGLLKIAAVILVILSSALLFWKIQQHNVITQPRDFKQVQKTIVPGSNKAYLTMADGSVVILTDSRNRKLSTQAGVQISNTTDGRLIYKHSRNDDKLSAQSAFNTITTPRGGQYQVILSDGTKVWLNSASSLKYPPFFSGKERRVYLTGEAYFEVAKNVDMPFKVSIKEMSIKVLGTHFNVISYKDEKEVKTTLLEGSVKLSSNGNEALLKPGQQGILKAEQSSFNIREVTIEDEVAWKNGLFAFKNESIQTIMEEISRWYDVDVIFNEPLVRRNFGGTISRFKDVAEVLRALELTGSVHFKVEGRRIIVMP